jgi:hypothetical protein
MRVRSCGPSFARSSGMFFSPRSKFNATSFAEFHLMGRRGTFPNPDLNFVLDCFGAFSDRLALRPVVLPPVYKEGDAEGLPIAR